MSSVPVSAADHWRLWRDHGPMGAALGALVLAIHRHSSPAGISWPGQGTLSAGARIGPRQVQRHLKALEANGWILRERAGPGSSLYLLTIPSTIATGRGVRVLSREDLLRDLDGRSSSVPERIRSAAIRAAFSFHGGPDLHKKMRHIVKNDASSRVKRCDIQGQMMRHPRSNDATSKVILGDVPLYEDEELKELKEEEPSSLPSSFHSPRGTQDIRSRLRSQQERIPERSRGIVRSLLGVAQWSLAQYELAERILDELPKPKPRTLTEGDRVALASSIAKELKALGIHRLEHTGPLGVPELLPVTSWKHRGRLLSTIGRGNDSSVDPAEIAAQIASMELGRLRVLEGRARA